ncbi:hypothetical protein [Dechloromonas denitrificans]|uniref:hypothetical protein n=1 Tax=Dechloromonas denitrificans TaxID=281362 RepID=UPI001CFA401A|nr:hypothetical protein [Dechloromonas denitrificans]UCV07355.1 hypothetical protein KI615_18455 [Dechloromonas denitrificans]
MLSLILKLLKLFATVFLLAIAPIANAGLFGFGGTSWKEEVLLHDGSKVIVDRSVERGGRHEIGQKSSYTKQNLSFTHPTTGKSISWEDKATEDLGTSSFLPMALDIYQGAVYLVAWPMGCLSYNKWGRPNPPYVVFRHSGKTWERVPLQELPLETKTPNLISSSPDTEVERLGKRFIDAETIRKMASELRQPENRRILRTVVASIGQECRAEYSNGKGAWLSADWFSDEKDLAACVRVCERKDFSGTACPCGQFFK